MRERSADINALVFHLKNCPDDFLQPSALGGGTVDTNALLLDGYRYLWGNMLVDDAQLPASRASRVMEEEQRITLQIACWFLRQEIFRGQKDLLTPIDLFLFNELPPLIPHVHPADWIQDEDRTEEFVRLFLHSCGFASAGETPEQASDRLDALSTLKRRAVLQESTAAMQRVKEIRQKWRKQKHAKPPTCMDANRIS